MPKDHECSMFGVSRATLNRSIVKSHSAVGHFCCPHSAVETEMLRLESNSNGEN